MSFARAHNSEHIIYTAVDKVLVFGFMLYAQWTHDTDHDEHGIQVVLELQVQ